MLLVEAALGSDTTTTLGFVITLAVLLGSLAAGILTSRVLQGRSIRDIEEWRDDTAKPQLLKLMTEHDYKVRREKERLHESAAAQTQTQGEKSSL